MIARSVAATSLSNVSFPDLICSAQRHRIGLAVAGDDEAQSFKFGVAPGDFGDLFWAHEHALHLGGLVGAAHPSHPSLDAHIAAAARARAGSAAVRSPIASRIQG